MGRKYHGFLREFANFFDGSGSALLELEAEDLFEMVLSAIIPSKIDTNRGSKVDAR